MSVTVHVAPHPEALVAHLCEQLASPPDDPFVPELIAVPTRGIERWITQQIASGLAARGIGDGICANISFPSPSRLVRDVLLAVPDLAASVIAWEGPVLIGHILDVIDRHLDEPWMRLIQRYVGTPEGIAGANRYIAATKIGRLFTTYGRRRPAMVRAWSAGANNGPGDAPVPEADGWQPTLWRLVREQIGVPALAELLPEGLDPIRNGTLALEVPDRFAVYGLTATDPHDLEVLVALGEHRDAYLYVLHPSPVLWDAVAGNPVGSLVARSEDPTTALADHPMLASWARDSRELQFVLARYNLTAQSITPDAAESNTALSRLQHDIRANRPLAQDDDLAAGVTSGTDRSLQIHVTHGARRQAEVVRDAILHALAADPTLEPRDVVIMTPDLATFAPLLEAAFPRTHDDVGVNHDGGGGLPDLRLRIADRSPAAVNPLLRFAAAVLDLADSRLKATAVREFVTRPMVQQRFGFDRDTAAEIVNVIDESHISWGLDGDDRAAWHAGTSAERTWSRGMDRALAGVFYSDSPVRIVSGTVPLHGVEGQEASPVGLLAALVDRLRAARDLLSTPMPVSLWAAAIADAVRLVAAPAWGDDWQLSQLERLLGETFPAPEPESPDPVLGLAEVRSAVASWTESRPSPLHFRTGDITVCTLVPMRSVPYRVVCLLGMDDDRFPRSSRSDGDDLLRDDERLGDFDRSSEDRQLLLDAVMAAGDRLIVTYAGRDQLTNAELPPAVPIAELQDAVRVLIGTKGLEKLTTIHPLQSFSAVNFTPGALDLDGPFGFDPRQLAGAEAITRRAAAVVGEASPWPEWEPPETIDLSDLIAFLEHPARRFMQNRMGFSVPERNELPDDTLPADLGGLGAWALKERLLAGLADGYGLDALTARERASDSLPPGQLGEDDLTAAVEAATALWAAAVDRGYDPQAIQPYRGTVAGGDFTVQGAVDADPGQAHLFTVTASRVTAKQRLRAYARLAFLTALEPDVEWKAVILGRRENGRGHVAVTLHRLGATREEREASAVERLGTLVALSVEGHRTPLPIPCESAYTWQRNLGKGRGKAAWAVRDTWENNLYSAEAADAAHVLLLDRIRSTDELLATGFEDYCERLWGPILPLCSEKSI